MWLLLLFIVIPFIELTLLIRLGEIIGFWNTVALIIGTGLIGSFLARREGLSAWTRFQQQLNTGGLPAQALLDGVIILMSGALLLTPGVLTDVVGLLGLFPPTRALLRRWIKHHYKQRVRQGHISVAFNPFRPSSTGFGSRDPKDISEIVDVEVVSPKPDPSREGTLLP